MAQGEIGRGFMAHAIWNGAVTFGLVHMPVGLYSATRDSGIDFQWLDRRTLDPVGYRRYNKRTGRELKMQDIVKGVRQRDGRYVVVSDAEVRAAFPKSTQTIEIESFVKRGDLPLVLLERPYYLQPVGKAEHVYALLREAIRAADVAGIARIVIHNKEHLAALLAVDNALVLEILRWSGDLRPEKTLALPSGAAARLKAGELQMARRLVAQMTGPWQAQRYSEDFSRRIDTLIKRKLAAGKAKAVESLEAAPSAQAPSNVIDLAELLRRSMHERRAPARSTRPRHKNPGRRARRSKAA
jgi:DNA end-binding protein Ku